jgi:hypothetical protein
MGGAHRAGEGGAPRPTLNGWLASEPGGGRGTHPIHGEPGESLLDTMGLTRYIPTGLYDMLSRS